MILAIDTKTASDLGLSLNQYAYMLIKEQEVVLQKRFTKDEVKALGIAQVKATADSMVNMGYLTPDGAITDEWRNRGTASFKPPVEGSSEKVLEYLNLALTNARIGRKVRTSGHREYIVPLFKAGYDEADLKMVIDLKIKQWKEREDMHQYLHPSTLFKSVVGFKKYHEQALDWVAALKEKQTSEHHGGSEKPFIEHHGSLFIPDLTK